MAQGTHDISGCSAEGTVESRTTDLRVARNLILYFLLGLFFFGLWREWPWWAELLLLFSAWAGPYRGLFWAARPEKVRAHEAGITEEANSRRTLEACERLINEFGAVLKRQSGAGRSVIRESDLPASKEALKRAFSVRVRALQEAGELDPQTCENVKTGYCLLANIVPDDEAEIHEQFDELLREGSTLRGADSDAINELAVRVASMDDPSDLHRKIADEMRQLRTEFDAVLAGGRRQGPCADSEPMWCRGGS